MADNQSPRLRNLTLAAIAGQAGCATLIIAFAALFFGLWLDAQFDQRGPFTIGVLILSVPLSLYVMLRIALGAIRRIQLTDSTDEPGDLLESEEVEVFD